MKKLIISTAVLAIAASCSNNETLDSLTNKNELINFSTLKDKVTRAANDPTLGTTTPSNYKVYAEYTDPASPAGADGAPLAAWYLSQELSATDVLVNGDAKFWPGFSLNFYGYAPANTRNVTATAPTAELNGSISIGYTVPDEANQDFTTVSIANQKKPAGGTLEQELVFKHMLTKINLGIKTNGDCAIVQKTGEGTLNTNYITYITQNSGTAFINKDSVSWTPGPALAGDARKEYTRTTALEDASPEDGSFNIRVAGTYIIAPQAEADGIKVQINDIKIVAPDGTPIHEGNLHFAFQPDNALKDGFEAGKQYNIYFVRTPGYIGFETSVENWVVLEDDE